HPRSLMPRTRRADALACWHGRRRSCRRCDELLASRVIAILVVADDLPSVLLRRLLDEVRRPAFRTLLGDRPIPQDEVAVGIIRAAEEGLAPARLALDDLAALVGILWARDARRLVLDVLAFRIVRARGELAVAALLDHQIRSAARALLVENLIRFCGPQAALLGGDQLPRRLALGVAGAREELAEAAAFHHHRLAAVLARLDLFVPVLRFGLLLFELPRVRALGIRAARDEWAELADLDQHGRAAAVADLVGLDPFLEVLHLLAGAGEVFLEFLVELGERLDVVGFALLDLVEVVLEAARVVDVDDVVEALGQEIRDDQAERRRLEA